MASELIGKSIKCIKLMKRETCEETTGICFKGQINGQKEGKEIKRYRFAVIK